jgi:anti-sigma regulatory factor (Ser/Thr protein kinase)
VKVTTFSRTYPSHPKSIRTARRDLGAFLKRCGCHAGDQFDICLAAAEAVANAIEHGHVPGGEVSVECLCDNDITVTVKDEGGGMRAKTWQRVLIKASAGGFGLLMMRGLMDDVKVDIDDDCGATVVMHKRCAWNRHAAFAHNST